jgi:uncharacterized protein YoaH (UPF0181 family)
MTKHKQPQVNLERWRPMVLEAVSSGQAIASYAQAQGVSRHTLYAAQALMRARGEMPTVSKPRKKVKAQPSTFVPVAVQAGLSITVQLPNGVQLHCQSLDDGALRGLLMQLSGLPCSA